MPYSIRIVFFCAACSVCGGVAAESTKTTPNSSEMSPTAWRRAQLEAADKSDKIMQEAERQPGLLGQYEFMAQASCRPRRPA